MVRVMSEVKRFLPQKTPIGTVMKESTEGYWIQAEDFDAQRLRADTAEAALEVSSRTMAMFADDLQVAEQRMAEMVELLNLADHYLQSDSFISTGDVIEHTQEMRDEFRKKIAAALNPQPEAGSHES